MRAAWGGREKGEWGVSRTTPEVSASTPTSGRLQPPRKDEGGCRRTAEQGAEHFMATWSAAEEVRVRLRHAVVCPNVTGRTKEMIDQSKRARAGSLGLVD